MASSREQPIVISDEEDDGDTEFDELPPTSTTSSTISASRKRQRTSSSPPSDLRHSKQRRTSHLSTPTPAPSDSRSAPTELGPSAKIYLPGATFTIPDNAADISEEILDTILNGEEPINQEYRRAPLRRLRNFVFFEQDGYKNTRRLMRIERLEKLDHPVMIGYGMARLADADLEDEVDQDDDDHDLPQYQYYEVLLGEVKAWWVGDGINDADIYVRTRSSWYLLEEPADAYRGEYTNFWVSHRLSQIIANFAINSPPNYGKAEFLHHLRRFNAESQLMIRRYITEYDLEQHNMWIQGDLRCLLAQNGQFVNMLYNDLVKEILDQPVGKDAFKHTSRSQSVPPTVTSTIKTVVTPLISQISQRYFKNTFEVVGDVPSYLPKMFAQRERMTPADRLCMDRDISREIQDSGVIIAHYRSLTFEDHYYEIDDCVAIEPPKFRDRPLEDHPFELPPDVSCFADEPRYGKIVRLFTVFNPKTQAEGTIRWAHIQLLAHGCMTDIGELADPNELFLTYECIDVGLACIRGVINVDFNSATSDRVIPPMIEPGHFYCRFVFDFTDGSFIDITQPPPYKYGDLDVSTKLDPIRRQCDSCVAQVYQERIQEQAVLRSDPGPSPEVVNIRNISYHLHDTILYSTRVGEDDEGEGYSSLLAVGLIVGWNLTSRASTCKVRKLGHMDKLFYQRSDATNIVPVRLDGGNYLPREHLVRIDERQLYLTREISEVFLDEIVRHCTVHVDPNWQPHSNLDSEPDEFFLTHRLTTSERLRSIERTAIPRCPKCTKLQTDDAKNRKPYKDNANGKPPERFKVIKSLDLCCGAGGFSYGLEQSGVFDFYWGVDSNRSCADTYKANFPRAKVYCQNLNDFARDALKPTNQASEEYNGSTRQLPPKRGEVDAIVASPPSADFSIQNRYQHLAGESKRGLPVVCLSLIDHYRPRFFMLESVTGMLRHQTMDSETGNTVSMAIIKIMLRALTSLGYSVRFGLFNSVNYGIPQDRTRLLLYGVKAGHPMPRIPLTSHVTLKKPTTWFTRFIRYPTCLPSEEGFSAGTTLAAAIGDLPPFDWTAHGTRFPPRNPRNLPTFPGESPGAKGHAGYIDGVPYRSPQPLTLYQARMRAHVPPGEKVTLHYTKTFSEGRCLKAARVVAVPLIANADHRKIPAELWDFGHSHALSAAARTNWAPGCYGRLSWEGRFQSAITRIEPTAKQGKVLHPSQRRLISIREAARGQGIPDHYVFCGDSTAAISQIGNAVPTLMAEAIGKACRDSLIAERLWKKYGKAWPKIEY